MSTYTSEHNSHSHPRQLRIAIVESNVLACMGLQSILAEFFPMVEIVVCESFNDLQQHEEEMFVHYFVSSRIYFEHAAYFRSCRGRSIVMVSGDMSISGVSTLNVCQSQAALVSELMRLQASGHHHHHAHASSHHYTRTDVVPPVPIMPVPDSKAEPVLSLREVEVALLLCRGYINKEVADKLNIGLTTVITHRKNIMEKLHARSLADVIVYCVMNGIFSV